MSAVEAWVARHGQSNWEMMQILRAVEQHTGVPRVVLEIGTFQGDSLRIWREVWDPDLLIGIQDTDETTPETAAALGVEMVLGKSQALDSAERVVELLAGRPIDFLYIDGDHLLTPVMEDWMIYGPLVREGGIVVLDDAVIRDNPTVEVFEAYEAIRHGRRTALLYDGTTASTGSAVIFR